MLQIQSISKQYKTGDLVQTALDSVSLSFRDSEFVSILGPSGSGKTTLLNIIGGLDRYDSGDLIINNVSTKNYKDRDWDSYRNHTIGFVFQSYNLIPHQTVLANVELALTIGGISKRERKQRAMKALERVGLKEQAHKRPNQMSGGQMQRVAIARALVNNPDILLADEPTGALDTETSVQVMELLKEVAKDRLVIMVTHNPELAEEYSTRIVKLKDGHILGDSDPYMPDTTKLEPPKHRNLGKASMSFLTALSLSLNNLLTKKGRTILTAFAGSIGIIGIALILSLSTGFQNYIDLIQEETLSSYPLSVTSETADVTSALLSMVSDTGEEKEGDVVEEKQYVSTMFSNVGSNDLKSFKIFLEENEEKVSSMASYVRYQYGVRPVIYTINCKDNVTKLNPNSMLESLSGTSSVSAMSSMMSVSTTSVFNEMIDNKEMLTEQYDVLAGKWPEAYDEAILVLSEPNGISDLLVYSLGLRDNAELREMITKLMAGETVTEKKEPMQFSYEDLMNIPMKVIDASSIYQYNTDYDIYEDMSEDKAFMDKVYENGLDLKIVGVVCAKEGETSMTLSPGVAYTKELTEYVIQEAEKSELVKKQKKNRNVNVFSGKAFDEEEESSGLAFEDMISIDEEALAAAFGGDISEEDISKLTKGYMEEISNSITADTTKAQKDFNSTLLTMTADMLNSYIDANYNKVLQCAVIKLSDVGAVVDNYMKSAGCKRLLTELEKEYLIPQETFQSVYSELLKGIVQGYIGMAAVDMSQSAENPTGQDKNEAEAGAEKDVEGETGDTEENEAGEKIDTELPAEDGAEQTVQEMPVLAAAVSQKIENAQSSQELSAVLTKEIVAEAVPALLEQDAVKGASAQLAAGMTEAVMKKTVLTKVGELTGKLMESVAGAFEVDEEAIADAFQFDLSEEELSRLMETMTAGSVESNADTNLLALGYQALEEPTIISFYFNDFDAKELFVEYLEAYNERMEAEDEEKVINYTDITGILMSSVSTIVDSVTYVLIAFVSISLVVSSIMIGIITYISVLERTKEIGVLRAIGASKKNITSIFNAETFIVGLCSGLLGVGVTMALVPPINYVIHSVTNNFDINAVLPISSAVVLIVLSVILTLLGGFIPAKQAAKKDPVLALRSE